MKTFAALVLASSLTAWGAAAQQTPGAALQPEHQGNIEFVSGGSSLDDRQALKGMESQYDLRLTFAVLPSHEYLSGVGVKIADTGGKTLLDTVSDGPFLYAQIPPGHYRLTVTNAGQPQTGDFTVAGNNAVARAFFWRQTD
jgi:hypothetical protein